MEMEEEEEKNLEMTTNMKVKAGMRFIIAVPRTGEL